MEFPALKEASGKLEARQKELAGIFAEAGPNLDMSQVKSIDGDSAAKVARIQALNTEMDDLGKKVDELKSLAGIAATIRRGESAQGENGAESGESKGAGRRAEYKSLGEYFTSSSAYKGRQGPVGPEAHLDIELKTLFETGNGFAPETMRTGRIVEYATRPIQIIDLIPTNTTTQAAVVYMEETTFVNNAAEVAEGTQYPESALALTEVSEPVRKIATWIPVTDEQLEDEPQARGYLNNRLPFMIKQRLDSQILVGNGTAPNLKGFLNRTGIQTQAKGGDVSLDAIYKAMTKVRVTGRAVPSAIVIHSNDWQDIRLTRTTDGIYIWGSPSDVAAPRIWGLPVVENDVITEGTALVGDFATYSELVTRRGIDVQISNSHADFFINGKQAIRADMRVALAVYRPAAFATVTGI